MRIVVRIDRMVLDGLPVERHERASLEATVRRELAERFLASDVPQPTVDRHVRRIVADPVTLSRPGSIANLGSAIGSSVHAATERGRRP
jgi:hypothetical protein